MLGCRGSTRLATREKIAPRRARLPEHLLHGARRDPLGGESHAVVGPRLEAAPQHHDVHGLLAHVHARGDRELGAPPDPRVAVRQEVAAVAVEEEVEVQRPVPLERRGEQACALHDLGHLRRHVHDARASVLEPLEEVLVREQRDVRAVLDAASDVVHLAVDELLEDERGPVELRAHAGRLGARRTARPLRAWRGSECPAPPRRGAASRRPAGRGRAPRRGGPARRGLSSAWEARARARPRGGPTCQPAARPSPSSRR